RLGAVPFGGQRIDLHGTIERASAKTAISDLRATVGALVLRATGEVTEDPWRVALDLASDGTGTVDVAIAEPPVTIGAVGGRVTIEHEGLSLAPLRLAVDGGPLEARGWVTGVDPLALDLRLEGRPYQGTLAADLALDAAGGARMRVEAAGIDVSAAAA